ncbi:hypothetical protein COEREDRAFT_80656 [Coemansia reversa NRRL 1564]|uniref:Uncharacterized protein n=1 Tax=Coemansia reversa (strain ATCC 12441 / NRRL 1564) TaxID=763665 RepID=A0A2G5BE89_COERN|nr:hypothetical protein COEREDRAFT_80656 [Coemansia reversa NRRL 1564]|eukprot:PIA17325.1 hypothetical protein COEREDRAFT_80656 [Coemansia reversa NRRL 1564]
MDKWRIVQESSISELEIPIKDNALRQRLKDFESCLEEMYQDLPQGPESEDIRRITCEFEKEFQLKQHLVELFAIETLPTSQVEMNIALWKTQPYVNRLLKKATVA